MKFEKRTEKAKKLIKEGIIPGTIYGNKFDTINIQLPEKDLYSLIKEHGTNSTFNATIESKRHIVYFKELQRDFLDRRKVIHFSLHKLKKGDTLTADIPLNFIGNEEIVKQGLVLQEIQNKLTVEFPIGQGISHIDVDVSHLNAENAIYVKDIQIPEEYKLHTDPELMVANAAYPKVEEEPEEEETTEEETAEETTDSDEEASEEEKASDSE